MNDGWECRHMDAGFDPAVDNATDADPDNDGVPDAAEVADGTDPRVLGSFLRHVTVVVTFGDLSETTTNYVAWGVSAQGWVTNSIAALPGPSGTNTFDVANSNMTVFVKSYRDMDRNGAYDPSSDILLQQAIPECAAPLMRFAFGDVDGDWVSDADERAEGTDPYDAGRFCFDITLVETGIFATP